GAELAGEDGDARGHRLAGGEAERLEPERRHDEEVEPGEEPSLLFLREAAGEDDVRGEAGADDLRRVLRRGGRIAPDGQRGDLRGDAAERRDRHVEPLVGEDRADEAAGERAPRLTGRGGLGTGREVVLLDAV